MNNKYKIVLVEDESNIKNLVQTMLETAGYQVIPAETCRNLRRGTDAICFSFAGSDDSGSGTS